MQPHGRKPTRLPRPWDSPGKNTGMGCHFLLQCMKEKSESEVAQSYPTLRDSMDCKLPGSSVQVLAMVNSATITMECMYLFKLWFSLDMCPEVGLQDHIVALFLVF